jgi:MoaA/NifB/PqqE/SkfB family radical SAM enzyme
MSVLEFVQEPATLYELRFLWLEITAKCNLICTHCYAESGPELDAHGKMTHGDWICVMDEAAELGCRSVQFIGGEPTMHPRLEDLVDHANRRGFSFIEVYTNATRLGEKLLGCFQRNRVHVATSFYSDDPAVHDQVTQTSGSWARTLRGIKSVLEEGLPLRVGVIETERNLGHGARAKAFLKALGVQNVGRDRERGVGRGDRARLHGDGECFDELCGQCWKGRLCVTSSGDVYPCVFSRSTGLGDVKSGLLSILKTTKLMEFRQSVRAMQERRTGLTGVPILANLAEALAASGGEDNPSSGCSPAGCSPAGCSPAGCSPAGCSPGGCSPTGRGADGYGGGGLPGSGAVERTRGIFVLSGELSLSGTNDSRMSVGTGSDVSN